MNLTELIRRHKLVVGLAAVLALAGLAYSYRAGPPVFQARASLALVVPSGVATDAEAPSADAETTTTTETPGNPLLRWPDRSTIQDVLVRSLSSRAIRADLRSRGFESSYDLGRSEVFYYKGPIVDIATQARDSETAIRDAQLLIDEARRWLAVTQAEANVATQDRVEAVTVVEPAKTVTLYASRTRRVAMAGILGATFVLVVAAAAEGVSRLRRRTRIGRRRTLDVGIGAA